MKKQILSFALLGLLLFPAVTFSKPKVKVKAQEGVIKLRKMDYGIRMGMSLAFPAGPLVEKASGVPMPGPVIGLNTRYYFSNKWSVQFGVDYYWNQTRFETPYSNFTYEGPIDIKMPDGSTIQQYDTVNIYYAVVKNGLFKNRYISIPVQANYHFNKVWSISFGGYLSMLMRGGMTGMATNVVLGDGSSQDFRVAEDVDFDESDQFSKWDYGLNFGANAQLPNGFNFDIRINGGLASLFKKDFSAPPGVYRNISMQGTIGYRIGCHERFKDSELK